MKNRVITGVLFIILGALIAFGPITIFPVCGVNATQQMTGDEMDKKSEKEGMQMGDDKSDSSKATDTKSTMDMGTGMVMKCHWTANVELGIGIIIALLGAFIIIFQSVQIRIGFNIAIALNGILALLIPTTLIGVCDGVHMHCHSLTQPVLVILSSAVIIAAVANTIYLFGINRKEQVKV